jgi:hypothetical protein
MHLIVLWCVVHCISISITVAVTIRDISISKLNEYRLIEKHSINARHKNIPPPLSNSRMTLASTLPSELFLWR